MFETMLQKTKHTTPLRKAVDFLIQEGSIDNDKDLLPLFQLESPGALSAYINGKPSKKGLRAFLDKYGDKVSKFFENKAEAEEGEMVSSREFIESLKSDKVFYQGVIKENLASINTALAKLVQIHENISSAGGESAQKRIKPIVDPQALNPVIPVPPHRKPGATQVSSKGSTPLKGKQNKG